MTACFRFARYGREMLHELDRLLHEAYGAPEDLLGNKVDPLDEAIYIILSFQTDLPRFKKTWQNLQSMFPRLKDIEEAPLDDISAALRFGGLHRQKARAIKQLLRAVRRQFGELSLDALRGMSDVNAERVLTRLPGISWKGARCVLLYGLNRQVFPIDGNTFRILLRIGVLPLSAVYRRLSLHNAVQDAIDPEMRRRYHVNLVVHGQRVCSPQHPRCGACPAAIVCRKRGLPSQVSDSLASRVERLHLSRSAEREASGRSVRREDRRSIVPTMAVAR